MNKPVYLGFSILELSNILMYEFCHDSVRIKYGEKAKLCYMNTDSFIVYVKTDDIYKDIAEVVETTISDKNCETRTPSPFIQCWLQVCQLISDLGCLAWLLLAWHNIESGGRGDSG